jgi:hypothetical protein
MKLKGQKRGRTRQLALTEQRLEIPRWETLPAESKREVISILVKILRGAVEDVEEVDSE